MSRRSERVNDLIRGALSQILRSEVKDPRVNLATISTVLVSGDLSHATVKVSVLGDDESRDEAVKALDKAKGFLRSRLASSVRLRKTPELHFELDRGAEHSQRISDLLESLDEQREPT